MVDSNAVFRKMQQLSAQNPRFAAQPLHVRLTQARALAGESGAPSALETLTAALSSDDMVTLFRAAAEENFPGVKDLLTGVLEAIKAKPDTSRDPNAVQASLMSEHGANNLQRVISLRSRNEPSFRALDSYQQNQAAAAWLRERNLPMIGVIR